MPEPETNPDYDRIFGGGGDIPVATDATEEEISFDPSEAITPLQPGKYVAIISERPEKKISNNGNPMLLVTFMVTEGEQVGSLQWRRYMLSGKGAGWTVEFLRAIGLDDEAAGKKKINPATVQGRRLVIHVQKQKDNPEFLEVHRVERHPDGPIPETF